MYLFFNIKTKRFFIYMEILEYHQNEFNSKLTYIKKHLITEKKHRRRLSMFICISNID